MNLVRGRRYAAMSLVGGALLVSVATAHAQSNANDAAAAEQLFIQGRQLLEAGEVAQACDQLRASQNLDPGLGTLLLLAHCYEKLGKTASAWATFRAAESIARRQGQADRQRIAKDRAELLEPTLSKLALRLPPEVNPDTLSFERDGEPIPGAAALQAVPVDPGLHRLRVSAPGKLPWSREVQVPDAPRTTVVDVPVLEDEPVSAPDLTPATELRPEYDSGQAKSSGQAAWGYTLGAVGLGGLGLGAALAVFAKQSYDDSLEFCRTEVFCSPRGLALRDTAEKRARYATIAAGVGGALLATGVVLVWSSPTRPSEGAQGLAQVNLGTRATASQLDLTLDGEF